MAHEVTIIDGVAKAVYAKQPAWHRLGVVWPDLLTIEEAMRESGIDFGVTKVPMAFLHPDTNQWVQIEDNIGIFGGDKLGDRGLVGIHTPDYETDGFGEHARALGIDGKVVESAVLLRKGKVFLMSVRLADLDRVLPDDSHYMSILTAYSSHDGSFAITLKDAAHRQECMNMLRALDGSSNGRVIRILHRGNKDEQRRNAVHVMTYAQERADYHEQQCAALLKKKLTSKQVQDVLDAVMPLPKPDKDGAESKRAITIANNKRDAVLNLYRDAPDLQNVRGTAWGLVQAFGDFADHRATYRSRGGKDETEKQRMRDESRVFRTVIQNNTVADEALRVVAAI